MGAAAPLATLPLRSKITQVPTLAREIREITGYDTWDSMTMSLEGGERDICK